MSGGWVIFIAVFQLLFGMCLGAWIAYDIGFDRAWNERTKVIDKWLDKETPT